MRQIIICFLCLCFFVVSPLQNRAISQSKSSYAEVENTKKNKKQQRNKELLCGVDQAIRVAGFVTNPPFGWVEVIKGTGTQRDRYINKGYGVDLFSQLTQKLKFKVHQVPYTSYLDALSDLRKGKIDVLAGAYYHKNILGVGVNLLTPSYFTNPIVAIFMKGHEREYTSFDDLKDLKGVVRQEEMIYPLIYTQVPNKNNIQVVSGSKKAFKMLANHEVDYMLTGLYSAEAEVRRFKLVEEIYFPKKALLKADLFFVFSSHSKCFSIKPALAKALKELQQDKTAYMQHFMSYVDNWGENFRPDAGLLEENSLDSSDVVTQNQDDSSLLIDPQSDENHTESQE